jgi:hypothetical protein
MEKEYVIYNFINEFLEGYSDIGTPCLTCFKEDAIKFNLKDAHNELNELHKMGFTGLQIKECKV